MKYIFTIGVACLIGLAGCEQKQPMEPGEDLFSELYDLKQIVLDSTAVQSGVIEPDWAELTRSPIGQYRGYVGKTLLKFNSFGTVANLPDEWIQSVELVVPVAYTSPDTSQDVSTTVTLHDYTADWSEESESIDPNNFSADTLSSAQFPGPVDSTAYDPMRFEISLDVMQTWIDTNQINNGILLQGTSDNVILYVNERRRQNPPHLRVTVIDTVPDTTHYNIFPQEDFASLTGGNIPQSSQDEIILQQAYGNRLTLQWDGILDSLSNRNVYIHSAELLLPFDPDQSYSDFDNHSIVIAQEATTEADSFQASPAYNPITRGVSASDTILVVGTTSSNNFLRQYVQRIVSRDSVNTPLVLGYSAEGIGIKHLTVLPYQSKLRLVYSEVQ